MFVCPICKISLDCPNRDINEYKCVNPECSYSGSIFPVINAVPLFIPFGESECIFNQVDLKGFFNLGSKNRDSNNKIRIFKSILRKIFIGESKKTIQNFRYLSNLLNKDTNILVIGGGTKGSGMEEFYSTCLRKSINIESIDVYYSCEITAIADAHYLPYAKNSFDIVLIQAVLEHVLNPSKVVSEINRVLVDGGHIYAETPFMQSVHEGPYDFTRYSHSGHRWLFRCFDEISSGFVNGAFSSSLFIFSYAIAGLLRDKRIGILIRILFTRFFKFLDSLTDNKSNIDVACGCYFLGKKPRKPIQSISPSWISEYYSGAQE